LKTCDLVTAILCGDACLEKASSDGEQGVEFVAMAEQVGAASYFAARGHYIIHPCHLTLTQPQRHAEFAQIAVGAGDFDTDGIHGVVQSVVLIQVNLFDGLGNYYGAQI
jgi:hypothetical protein